jgi:hypothetical protein
MINTEDKLKDENPHFAKSVLQAVAVELKEPNHLDFKVQNKYGEWVWKSAYAMNRYADEWEAWHNQEREKFKEKHGLSDKELNYRGEQVLGTEDRSHCH